MSNLSLVKLANGDVVNVRVCIGVVCMCGVCVCVCWFCVGCDGKLVMSTEGERGWVDGGVYGEWRRRWTDDGWLVIREIRKRGLVCDEASSSTEGQSESESPCVAIR